jgi:hypothetical protein
VNPESSQHRASGEDPNGAPAETAAPAADGQRPVRTSGADRWVKLAFLVIALGLGFVLWRHSRGGPDLKWPIAKTAEALGKVLADAHEQDRWVVAYFTRDPRSAAGNRNVEYLGKGQNVKALKEGNFMTVEVKVDPGDALAEAYKVSKLPTLLLLDPQGTECNRMVGAVGEVDFRKKFLMAAKPPGDAE